MGIGAMNAGMTVEHLVAARKAEAQVATKKTTEVETVGKPIAVVRPAEKSAAGAEAGKDAAMGAKRPAAGVSASSVKRARKKPLVFGIMAG